MWWKSKLTFIASSVSIANQRWITSTNFLMVLCSARRSLSTRIAPTQRHTFFLTTLSSSIITFLSGGAIIIGGTSNLLASYHWVTLQSWWTETNSFVSIYPTFCPASANKAITWVGTFLIYTSLVKWTIVINQAFVFETLLIWISSPATWTATNWSMRRGFT